MGPSGGSATYSPAQVASSLTTALIPPIADQSYPCNTSGATATPNNVCTIPTAPTSRTLSLSTAYQATTTTKPAIVTVNLSSSASLTLTSGATNTAIVVIGSTSGVASGTGTTIATYTNSLTGTLVVGLAINTNSVQTVTFALPSGWYFAVLQQTGTVSINSAFDQSLG